MRRGSLPDRLARSMQNRTAEPVHELDELTERVVDRLIAEVDRAVVEAPAPTSALVDGSAAARRRRRVERRMLAAVVRSLPSRRSVSRGAGEAA